MKDKTKKTIAAYVGIAALLGGASKLSYEIGKYNNKPKAVVQRDLDGDQKPDQVISTYGKRKFIFMNDGNGNYMRLPDYMQMKKDNIVRQTEDIN
jgi:hypothetical protein